MMGTMSLLRWIGFSYLLGGKATPHHLSIAIEHLTYGKLW
jgi:hypothetical protein